MLDLHLSEAERTLLSNALDERLRALFDELIHTDDRALKRTLSKQHSDLEELAHRVRVEHQSVPPAPPSPYYVTKAF
jgi:hypothetical protein